jgi:hypothetical protein
MRWSHQRDQIRTASITKDQKALARLVGLLGVRATDSQRELRKRSKLRQRARSKIHGQNISRTEKRVRIGGAPCSARACFTVVEPSQTRAGLRTALLEILRCSRSR